MNKNRTRQQQFANPNEWFTICATTTGGKTDWQWASIRWQGRCVYYGISTFLPLAHRPSPRVISLWINRLCRHLQRNQTSSDVPSILRWLCVISRLWPLLLPRPQDSANAIGVWSSVKHTDDKKVPFKCRRKSIEISVSLVFHISEEVSSNWIHLRHR